MVSLRLHAHPKMPVISRKHRRLPRKPLSPAAEYQACSPAKTLSGLRSMGRHLRNQ